MDRARQAAAEMRVQDALEKIEAAQHLLEGACADLSAISGALGQWKKTSKLTDKVHDHWRQLSYGDRRRWVLDSMHALPQETTGGSQ